MFAFLFFFLFLVSRKRMPLTDWCGLSRFIFEPSDRQNRILEHLIHLGACHCGYFLTLELSPRDHNSISYRATNKNTQKLLLMSRCGEKITTYHFSHRRQLFSRLVFVSCHDRHEILKFFLKILVENFGRNFFGLEVVWVWWGGFNFQGRSNRDLINSKFTIYVYVFGRNNDSKIHKIQKKSSGCPKSSGTADTPHCFHYCVHV